MKISNEYSAEIDDITLKDWQRILLKFDDANIFQTWKYGANKWGENKLSHLILKKSNEVVAAAQVWYVNFPVIKGGIAHVSWGPMWRLHGKELNFNNLRNMIKALYREFVIRRGALLRIRPYEIDNTRIGNKVQQIFEEENLKKMNEAPFRTVMLDLSPDLDELRMNLRKSWRRQLNKATKKDITVIEGSDEKMFDSLCKLYKKMLKRKRFSLYVENIDELKQIQSELPSSLKMKIFLCQHEGEFVSGQAITTLGNTAMGLISATSNKDVELKLGSSYLFDWEAIKWMKEKGYKYYDLHGYDPVKYPGPSYYKEGVGGDCVSYLDTFESVDNLLSLVIVKSAKFMVSVRENIKTMVKKCRNVFYHP